MDQLSAAQRGRVRRASTPRDENESGGELNVVPFLDIIVNVMMFVLATVAVTFTSTADVKPPSTKPSKIDAPSGLAIVVVDDGFSVKTNAGTVANVPRGDYAELKRVVSSLKTSPDDKSVTITASAGVRYESVIATMDAVRETDDGKDLFPDVAFGVVR